MEFSAGLLLLRIGPRLLGFICLVGCSIMDLLIPTFAEWGSEYLIMTRIIQGMFQAAMMPIMGCLMGRWINLDRRSRYSAFIHAGVQAGAIIGQTMAGYMSQVRSEWDEVTRHYQLISHWPTVHHVFGLSGLLFSLWWLFTIYDSPADHPNISVTELKEYGFRPWIEVEAPDTLTSGWMSSIPYAVQFIIAQIVAIVSDAIITRRMATVTSVRKWNNVIALGGAGFGLLGVGLLGCRQMAAVTALTLTVGLMGFVSAGFHSNPMDLSPVYSGNIISLTNTLATLTGIFGPILVGEVTKTGSIVSGWMLVFVLSACISWAGALINLVYTSGVPEPWGMGHLPQDSATN